jgi:hypothetical protein
MKAKYYSPRIRRDLVSRLHREKEARGIPMTTLADRLISAALLCSDALTNDHASIVADMPTCRSRTSIVKMKAKRV